MTSPVVANIYRNTINEINPETGETYIGRTSGYGSPQENIKRRDRNHHKNKDGFERAELIYKF